MPAAGGPTASRSAPSRSPEFGERGRSGPLPGDLFVNPIAEGADPCVVRIGERYLWCQSEANVGVSLWTSDRLTTLGERHVVWRAPADGPASRQVWAPELFFLDGRWRIYLAASDGRNRTHRSYVLTAESDDPLGPYRLGGPLATGDGSPRSSQPRWAIDLTVLEYAGRRFALWSGWPDGRTDSQCLYIAPMSDPTTIAGPRVRVCANDDFPWELTDPPAGRRGLNEAPQVLQHDGRTFVLYSCGASWLPTYGLGLLELRGDDPLDPACWYKHPEPAFQGTDATFGVGHSGFVTEPDGSWWHVFHAKVDREPGWRRALFVQPMGWDDDGLPRLGRPVAPGEPVAVPAETPARARTAAGDWHFPDSGLGDFDYYGHQQFLDLAADGVLLGQAPDRPVNDYRSGEKLVLRDGRYADVRVTTELRLLGGALEAGLLIRVTAPAVGPNAQRGYYAAVSASRGLVTVGKMDGRRRVELGTAPYRSTVPNRLTVEAVGPRLTMYLDGQPESPLAVTDDEFAFGSVGLRVSDTAACYRSLSVRPLANG
ncbi:MAG TPA: glycoside hydrolase family 43 protein [Nocardioidaceae bacterium]|nr:glycoside hydrolase family 43 protein [Nocardioidaceae bacterium]